ncbi:MAG TPA: hypothetical protein VGF23_18035 [Gaiellaceae bacterium]
MARERRLRRLAEAECYARCYGMRQHRLHVVKLHEDGSRVPFSAVDLLLKRRLEDRSLHAEAL